MAAFLLLVAAWIPAPLRAQTIPTGFQEYLVIGYEEHVWNMFDRVDQGETGGGTFNASMETVVSITASADDQIIYYDHWEDGYDPALNITDPNGPCTPGNPCQASTLVLGDSDNGDGDASGFTNDPRITGDFLLRGTNISLESLAPNDLRIPRRARDVGFDGGDRILTSGGPVAIVHAQKPEGTAFIGGASEVIPRTAVEGALSFSVPVGVDTYGRYGGDNTAGEPFKYVYLNLAAFDDGTNVTVDNGLTTVNFVLNQGEHYDSGTAGGGGSINQNAAPFIEIREGTQVTTDRPLIGFVFTAGDANYASRFFTLLPDRLHGNDFMTTAPGDVGGDQPLNLYIYNPKATGNITVLATDTSGSYSISVPPRQVRAYTEPLPFGAGQAVPANSTVRLTSDEQFWGFSAYQYDGPNADWGHSWLSSDFLSDYYVIAWAPGTTNLPAAPCGPCNSENRSPVYVSATQDRTLVQVDLDADGIFDRIDTDSNDVPDCALPFCDPATNTYRLDVFETLRIFDHTDWDNTGTQVIASKPVTLAYGQDVDQGVGGDASWDLGYSVYPLDQRFLELALTLEKTADTLSVPDGGGIVTYRLTLRSHSFAPLSNLRMRDLIPSDPDIRYVPGSTAITYPDQSQSFDDPTVTGNELVFLLTQTGMGGDETLTVEYQVEYLAAAPTALHRNHAQAKADYGTGTTFSPEASLVVAKTDVVLLLAVDREVAPRGTVLDYTVDIENVGPTPETASILVIPIPPNATYVPGSATGGGVYDPAQNAVVWTLGDLPAGAMNSFTFQATINGDAPLEEGIDARAYFDSQQTASLASNLVSTLVSEDWDRDGIPDAVDIDDDNDGIPDVDEGDGLVDVDSDGIPDSYDLDSDNDGIHDLEESGLDETRQAALDADGDGQFDAGVPVGANGLADDVETAPESDLPDYDGDGAADPQQDTDGDAVPDFRDLDSDNDGIHDVIEGGNVDRDGNGRVGRGVPPVDAFGRPAASTNSPPDSDGDGIADYRDLDSDDDGINDVIEGGHPDPDGDALIGTGPPVVDGTGRAPGTDSNPPDTDGDGMEDFRDVDSNDDGTLDVEDAGLEANDPDGDGRVNGPDGDQDGIKDVVDGAPGGFGDSPGVDSDSDGVPDSVDIDDDNDGIPDVDEGPAGRDTDSDGVPDSLDLDSDNDGIHDLEESGLDEGRQAALDADGDGQFDAGVAVGANGLADMVETAPESDLPDYDGNGTADPQRDTDSDGVPDFRDLDSDNDGINDVIEGGSLDTDGNGRVGSGIPPVDAWGRPSAGSTNSPPDSDGDGIPDYRDLDSDDDGINDVIEGGNPDPDGDAIIGDGPPVVDPNTGQAPGANSNPPDTDGDGMEDFRDVDSNDDGTLDVEDAGLEANDPDGDGRVNGPDGDGDGIKDVVDGRPGFGDSPGADSDSDGIPDSVDIDDDNDGIPDVDEGPLGRDTDSDGVPDSLDLDSDNDGIHDLHESGLDPARIAALDTDLDGQFDAGTPVGNNGLADQVETTPESDLPDYDGDGRADPQVDTDSDGVPDFRDLDSDNDGIHDVTEANLPDPDGDGRVALPVDAWGRPAGSSSNPPDTDGDTVPDYRDLDSDNDTINDVEEGGLADPDGDGFIGTGPPVVDGTGRAPGTTSSPPNTDGAGSPDFQDLDSNDDGTNDIEDAGNGGLDGSGDGRPDDQTDTDRDGIPDIVDGRPLVFGDAPPTLDTDGDTIPDNIDEDDDNDGRLDVDEGPPGEDSDSDGIPDAIDLDSDNDGTPDTRENGIPDTDGDGRIDMFMDADGNGVDDRLDAMPAPTIDTDSDGIADLRDLDSDNDGVPDTIEAGAPDADKDGVIDDFLDGDLDGYDDTVDPDRPGGVALELVNTDGDAVPDRLDLDSDNDGIPDIVEAGGTDTDADGRIDNFNDPDRDGYGDEADPTEGGVPWPTPDTDSDGFLDHVDLDADDDGVTDCTEASAFASPDPDLDGDGIIDGFSDADSDGLADSVDPDQAGVPLPVPDVDSDGTEDFRDLDTDADSLLDVHEGRLANVDPVGADSDSDGIDDAWDPDLGGPAADLPDVEGDGVHDWREPPDMLRNDQLMALTDYSGGEDLGSGTMIFANAFPALSLEIVGPNASGDPGEGGLEEANGTGDDDFFYADSIFSGWLDPDPTVSDDENRPLVFYQLDCFECTVLIVREPAGIRAAYFPNPNP